MPVFIKEGYIVIIEFLSGIVLLAEMARFTPIFLKLLTIKKNKHAKAKLT